MFVFLVNVAVGASTGQVKLAPHMSTVVLRVAVLVRKKQRIGMPVKLGVCNDPRQTYLQRNHGYALYMAKQVSGQKVAVVNTVR